MLPRAQERCGHGFVALGWYRGHEPVRSPVGRGWLAAFVAMVLLVCGSYAFAHAVTSRTENNRYVWLKMTPEGLHVTYLVLYGELPAFYVRRAMDTNGDGFVSDNEAQTYASARANEWSRGTTLFLGGRRERLMLPQVTVALGDVRIAPTPVSVEARGTLRVPRTKAIEISVEPGGDPTHLGETEVMCEGHQGVRLTAMCLGRPPCRSALTEPRYLWRGPKRSVMEDRTISCVFEFPQRGGTRAALGAGVVMVGGLAGLVGFLLRRRGQKRLGAGRGST